MTATETMPVMEASSLRALALSTLKSKRRRPAPKAQPAVPLFSRPLPPAPSVDSMQLDYGEDEPSSRIDVQAQGVRQGDKVYPITRDVLMREEGEISSDEEAPSKRDSTAVPSSTDSTMSTPQQPYHPLPTSPVTSLRHGALSLLDRITDAPQVLPTASGPSIPLSERISSPPVPIPIPDQLRTIHKSQVRPNVTLNQTDYDAAKDYLLDILGYGVPPKHLLDLGISREFVYYAFTELNLRLPDDFDDTGLLPYNPHTAKDFNFVQPESLPTLRDRIQPASAPTSSTAVISIGRQRAILPHMEDLDDVEALKRRELQARKAVLATRKRKGNTNLPPRAQSTSVDDFLMTLASQSTPTDATISCLPTPTQTDSPSLTPGSVDSPLLLPHTDTPVDAALEVREPSALSDVTPPLPSYESAVQTPNEGQPSSTDSMTLTFKSAMQLSPETYSGSVTPVTQYPPRRGLKRPVASDFVDVDTNPPGDYWITSYDNTQAAQRKRPATSFVNVKQPRTVIDISDSEGEDDEDEDGERPTFPFIRTVPPNRSDAPSRTGPSSGAITPAVLQEKELEILKMRERIAEMERQKLLKKIGIKTISAVSSNGRLSPSVTIPLPVARASFIPQTSPTSVLRPTTPFETTTPDSSGSPVVPLQESPRLKTPDDIEVDQVEEQLVIEGVDDDVEMFSSAQASQAPEEASMACCSENQSDSDTPAEASRHENPAAYDSLFASYPALRLSLHPSLAGALITFAPEAKLVDSPMSETSASASLHLLDLKPLRERAWKKSVDPNSVLCQYEFPGGGVCRDTNCEDIHLSKLDKGFEPNEHDTAEYICRTVSGLDFDTALKIFREETANHPSASLEDRVARAIASRPPERRPTT